MEDMDMVESMHKKHDTKKISSQEYENYLSQKRGFKNASEYRLFIVQKKGFKTLKEYQDYIAQKRGFKNHSSYCNYLNHRKNKHIPFSVNKECGLYLGVYISERVLSNVFSNVDRMPHCNPGYDFICGRGYKIDVKAQCPRFIEDSKRNESWIFHIRKNKIADYFLLLAFDNRDELNPQHIWLIKSDETIRGRKFNEYVGFSITNSQYKLNEMKKFELENKLESVKKQCNELRSNTI